MTRYQQKNVLSYFKNGKHSVIIATSIAEEGIDVTACNLVIRYDHVTNEIVRAQSRGKHIYSYNIWLVKDPGFLDRGFKFDFLISPVYLLLQYDRLHCTPFADIQTHKSSLFSGRF